MGPTTVIAVRCALVASLLSLAPPALAYETDQLTWRDRPLVDGLEPANAEMTRLIDLAVAMTNRVTGCRAEPERAHAALARRVSRFTASRRWAWKRGFWRAPGFGVYTKWMEQSGELDRIPFEDREDFYGDLTIWQAPILHVAGPCSTFEIAGVRLGSDKMDHFLSEGFHYWKKSRKGVDPARGVEWGTRTENEIYGLMTSLAFSFADLRANWDGYTFYASLLEPDSVVTRAEDGCLARTRDFDWSEYVDDQYDEVHTPPVFPPRLEERLAAAIRARAPAYCAGLPTWAPDGWAAVRQTHAIAGDEPWIGSKAPPPTDPYELDVLCATLGSHAATPKVKTRRR